MNVAVSAAITTLVNENASAAEIAGSIHLNRDAAKSRSFWRDVTCVGPLPVTSAIEAACRTLTDHGLTIREILCRVSAARSKNDIGTQSAAVTSVTSLNAAGARNMPISDLNAAIECAQAELIRRHQAQQAIGKLRQAVRDCRDAGLDVESTLRKENIL